MEPVKKIELFTERSEEVQEILGTPPRGPILWGTTAVFLAMIVFIIISWIIQYPDELHAEIVLTTSIPPHRVVARASGKIDVFVNENDGVKKNDLLCILDNPARHNDVFFLSSQLDSIENDVVGLSARTQFVDHLSLGELQQDYNDFVSAVNRLRFFDAHHPIEKEINSLRVQIKKNHQKLQLLTRQKSIYERQLQLVQLDYDRDKKLFNEKVIAAKALEITEQQVLTASGDYEAASLNLTATQIRVAELENELQSRNIQNAREKNDLTLALQERTLNLKSAIAKWEQKYALRSPIDGKVSFFNYWSKHQFAKEGDEVMVIVPDGPQVIVGKVRMPVQNSGKAKKGQRVNIHLDNYPYEEYGMLVGLVKNISLVPRENLYAIDVELPANLITTYQKKLEFRHELQGSAEIITEDLRLLERIFYEFRKIFVN